MASETVASAIDEQIVNKEKSEAIADLITSLANEDEVKHDKPEDPNEGHTTPSSKPEDETNSELRAVEVQKSDDSPALEASAEDNLKHDKIEDAKTQAIPLSKTEEDTKPEPAVVVENTDDPVSLDAHVEDILKEEIEVIPDSHDTDESNKSQPNEAPSIETAQQLEKEFVEVEEEKLPETFGIPEASDETIEKSNNIAEDIPQTESEAEFIKEEETVVTEGITIEETTRELSPDILKEANDSEAVPTETVKAEPVVTEVEEKPREVIEVAEDVGETSKDSIPLKGEKTDKEKETSIIANSEQVSDPENRVDSSLEVAEKVPEVDGKKESGVSKDEAAISEVPEENDVVENDYKKEPEAPEAAQESSRKDKKEIEAKTPTTEDDGLTLENLKDRHTEISSAVSEPVRETLASKFEQESTKTGVETLEKVEAEEALKTDTQVPEDVTKTSSKDIPEESAAKPTQKQSNNIISKVKQSLVKAKKAIIGKSPSSKNHSTEGKDDIPIK